MPGSSNISGDESIIFCDNMSFDGTERGGKMTANGQLWVGSSVAPHVRLATLTAGAGTTITNGNGTITISASSTSDVQTLTGNSGGAVSPIGGTINVVTANSTVKFVGTAGNLTQDFNLSNLVLGNNASSITSATFNVGLGSLALNGLTSGSSNSCIGFGAGNLLNTADSCTLVGAACGDAITSSPQNTACGAGSLGALSTGTGNNTAIGYLSLSVLGTGSSNTCVGANSGSAYTTTESGNIILGNSTGTIGESNVIRIGTTQTQTFIVGIINTSSGRVVKTTTPGAYPYTALTTDYLILVDSSSARTINLMATPTTGTVLVIKDNVGSAASNNITVTPAAGNIDGSSSYVMSTNYQSITLVYNSVQWNII